MVLAGRELEEARNDGLDPFDNAALPPFCFVVVAGGALTLLERDVFRLLAGGFCVGCTVAVVDPPVDCVTPVLLGCGNPDGLLENTGNLDGLGSCDLFTGILSESMAAKDVPTEYPATSTIHNPSQASQGLDNICKVLCTGLPFPTSETSTRSNAS